MRNIIGTIEIALTEDVNLLDEVVVTAGKAPSLAGGLTGKVAGLQINAIHNTNEKTG